MKCTFYRPEKTNIEEFRKIVEKMRNDLDILMHGETSAPEVYEYVLNLLRAARPLEHNDRMCFWGLDDPNQMPSDARDDFFYEPTYIAAAFLIQAVLRYPELKTGAETAPDASGELTGLLDSILPKAMNACTGRQLRGAGYNGLRRQIENMKFFLNADIIQFLEKNPDECPEFREMFYNILKNYGFCIKEGKTIGDWNTDFAEEMLEVLQLAGVETDV